MGPVTDRQEFWRQWGIPLAILVGGVLAAVIMILSGVQP